MSRATAPNGDETHIRAIVFKEGEFYVAQCLEYDISAQSATIEGVIDRLELTLEADSKPASPLARTQKIASVPHRITTMSFGESARLMCNACTLSRQPLSSN